MKILVGNWKLNPQKLSEAQKLLAALNKVKTKNRVVICPPFPYLPLLKTKFELGAQNISVHDQGAYTGEVSARILRQFKVKYGIIGHSERRAEGESDEQVNAKLKQAIENQITPVLCVGFGIGADAEEEDVLAHLRNQLQADLPGIDPKKIIVAYEPVWAIGTEKTPGPDHVERVAMFVKIKFKIGKFIYGGGTSSASFRALLDKAPVDGLLVGHNSLKIGEFSEIIKY